MIDQTERWVPDTVKASVDPPRTASASVPAGGAGSVTQAVPGPVTSATLRRVPEPSSTASPWPEPPPVAVARTLQPGRTAQRG